MSTFNTAPRVSADQGLAGDLRRFTTPVVTPEQDGRHFIEVARELGEKFARTASERDSAGVLPVEQLEDVRRLGLSAIRLPREYGGPQLSYRDTVDVLINLAKGDPSVAQVQFPHITSIERIRLSGTEAQRRLYLDAVRHGAVISGATTERGSKIRTEFTTAITWKDGKRLLNGTKYYSTGGLMADIIRVTARDEQGHSVSVILPRDRKGIEQLDDWRSMGQRGTASGTTRFVDVAIHDDEIIPFDEAERTRRNYQAGGTQLLHSTIEVGIALAVLDDASTFAREKARVLPESGVGSGAEDPYVLHTIGEIAARAHNARAILRQAAEAVDAAHDLWHAGWVPGKTPWETVERVLVEASIGVAEAKILCNQAALRSAELLYEVGGASSTASELNFDRHWRNARTHSTHDATAYKHRIVGDYHVNGKLPPITMYY